jgi:hypothetical protein
VDLTKAVAYRGFNLNSLTLASNDLSGCEIKRVDWPGVPGVGYDEKRALDDGYDASDVFLGKRLVGLTGAIYSDTRKELYDLKQALVTALTPTAAYDDDPGAKGFMPMDFYVPTGNTIDFPASYIHQMVLVRPVRQPTFVIESDKTGGLDTQPLSMEWTALLEAKDPRVYFFTSTDTAVATGTQSAGGSFVNKGDYPTPLNILLIVTSVVTAPVPFHFVGAGTDMTISLPVNASQQIFRYSAREKVLTLEVAGVEVLRQDLLSFANATSHPLVPVGTSAWTWTKTSAATFAAGGRLWHYDAWA